MVLKDPEYRKSIFFESRIAVKPDFCDKKHRSCSALRYKVPVDKLPGNGRSDIGRFRIYTGSDLFKLWRTGNHLLKVLHVHVSSALLSLIQAESKIVS
jgi:hypothetical protein